MWANFYLESTQRSVSTQYMKDKAAVSLGKRKSEKKAKAARENGKKGGYWSHKKNLWKTLS